MKFPVALLSLVSCLVLSSFHPALAEYEEVSYEDLLKELNTKTRTIVPKRKTGDFFNDVRIHAGLGFINSQLGIEVEDRRFFRHQSGIQLAVGIDLASPRWQLEGAIRNYGHTNNGSEFYSLREFDLRIVHQQRLSTHAGFRIGGGLAARYLNYERTAFYQASDSEPITKPTVGDGLPPGDDTDGAFATRTLRITESTPSAIAFIGFDYFLTDSLSAGFDFNGRASMVNQTADQMAVDVTFRIDTHF